MAMWTSASTTALWTQLTGDVGSILFTAVGAVLTVTAGLIGVGYGYRLVKKHITGRKF